jgi:hypothetical protein
MPDLARTRVISLALAETKLSPREIAARLMNHEGGFVLDAALYLLLKARSFVIRPAFTAATATKGLHTRTSAPNQLLQTDFTRLEVVGWRWIYLSTMLHD